MYMIPIVAEVGLFIKVTHPHNDFNLHVVIEEKKS